MAEVRISQKRLPVLDGSHPHKFVRPAKKIQDGDDVAFFLTSTAYRDLWSFIFQLNASMFPRKNDDGTIQVWELGSSGSIESSTVTNLRRLLEELGKIVSEAPPDTGPRRFGNVSFRKWYGIVESRLMDLMDQYLPAQVLNFGRNAGDEVSAKEELTAYIMGSFGSAQRLDYGTGHELSFLAFLGCIWKLGGFQESADGEVERSIVLGVIEPYLELIRKLILTYTLEPAGSHGVWGLDDHSFLPYIFGSAQMSPAIKTLADIATEGSVDGAPDPSDVSKAAVVERERKKNMYFSAIGFIYDVKKGPFWEHSPILFDISGVKAGWAKINKGMLKMYNAEVLSKFPVVQHFPFGSLFCWERDPEASAAAPTAHTRSQPTRAGAGAGSAEGATRAPWASATVPAVGAGVATTAAPWARPSGAHSTGSAQGPMPPTRAPWAPGGPSRR